MSTQLFVFCAAFPENTLKYAVGIILTSLGTFWADPATRHGVNFLRAAGGVLLLATQVVWFARAEALKLKS